MAAAEAAQFKAKGNEFYKKREWDTAVEWYGKAIAADPDQKTYYSNRAAALTNAGRFEEAVADGKMCIQKDPSWNKGYYRLATALKATKDYVGALDAINAGLKRNDIAGDAALLKLREEVKGPAEQQKNDRTAALPENERFKAKGNELFKTQKYEDAIAMYTRALDHVDTKSGSPLYVSCYNNRAACKQQLGDHPGVVEDCSMVLEHDEYNQKALLRRGLAFEAIEKFVLGLEDIRKLLYINPNIDMANRAQHRLSNAVRAVKKARAAERARK